MSNALLRDELRENGFENVKKFSWDKFVAKTVEMIE